LKSLKSQASLEQSITWKVSFIEVSVLGAIEKLGTTVVTYPFLVVKLRLKAKQEMCGNQALSYT